MAHDTDRIETSVLIAAPLQRVWDLVTSAEHVGRWFGDAGAEIDLRPGGAMSLSWREHGTYHGRVEAVEPPTASPGAGCRRSGRRPTRCPATRP